MGIAGISLARTSKYSSGDYKNPPPVGQHAGLLRYQKSISADAIDLAGDIRAVVGRSIVASLLEMGYRVLWAAVADRHAHAVVELPFEIGAVQRNVGEAKRVSSRSVKKSLPGRIWSAGGTYKLVADRSHLKKATEYVL